MPDRQKIAAFGSSYRVDRVRLQELPQAAILAISGRYRFAPNHIHPDMLIQPLRPQVVFQHLQIDKSFAPTLEYVESMEQQCPA